MANITLVSGTIKHTAGKGFPSKHPNSPNRINIVVTLANGGEATVWGDEGGTLTHYKRGEAIQLVYDGKNYQVVDEPTDSAQVAPLPSTQTPESAEAAWDAKLNLCATRYGKAIAQAKAIAYHQMGMSAEAFANPDGKLLVQAIALSLYIEVNKR
jgi:hypothetical protein